MFGTYSERQSVQRGHQFERAGAPDNASSPKTAMIVTGGCGLGQHISLVTVYNMAVVYILPPLTPPCTILLSLDTLHNLLQYG